MKNLSTQISTWLKKYSEDSSTDCFVIGVSGGVDSALSSTLCAETGIKTYVIDIPINSKQKNTNLSELHCNWLCEKYKNVEKLYIDASEPYQVFENMLAFNGLSNQLASANSKSRMRMMLLYHIATCKKGLVVGTGNKVEDFGVGFYTKYGDGGVDISPIADLTKTQVKNLAESLGVSKDILNAPPTDGLWEDSRTDESQIGATYEELEWAMSYIDSNLDGTLSDRQQEVLNIYNSFHRKNEHKMLPIPVFKLGE